MECGILAIRRVAGSPLIDFHLRNGHLRGMNSADRLLQLLNRVCPIAGM
jgi:hypothetical protein